jgi:hypothetical protein
MYFANATDINESWAPTSKIGTRVKITLLLQTAVDLQENSTKLVPICFKMSLSEAAERLEGAFAEADSKINNLNEKIDETFKAGNDNNETNSRGPAELMQTLADVRSEFKSIVKEVS